MVNAVIAELVLAGATYRFPDLPGFTRTREGVDSLEIQHSLIRLEALHYFCAASDEPAVFREHSTESIMSLKTRDLLTRSWQSQANLSLFLFMLSLMAFFLPSLGFEKNSLHFYDDAAASVVAVVGTAIAWRNRKLFLLTSVAVIVAIAFRWGTWWRPTQPVRLWKASTGLVAIIMITVVLLWQVFRPGPVTGMRVQGAIAAYLLLAFGWAHAYHIAELVDSNAFK